MLGNNQPKSNVLESQCGYNEEQKLEAGECSVTSIEP
jgi:hypothetical protein